MPPRLFLIAGAEFLAMILVVVYVGAVAVLFLFVVMMLDIDFEQLRGGLQRYLPASAPPSARRCWPSSRLRSAAGHWRRTPIRLRLSPMPADVSNTQALGSVLYTDYLFLFQTGRADAAGGDDRRDRADAARPQVVAASDHPDANRADGRGDPRGRFDLARRRDHGELAASAGRATGDRNRSRNTEPVHGHH